MNNLMYTDSIEKLGLSRRSYNALARSKILTIKDLLTYPSEELMRIRNLGQKSYLEVVSIKNKIIKGELIINDEDSDFARELNKDNYIFNILNVLENNIYGLKINDLIENLDNSFKNKEYLRELVSELISNNKIIKFYDDKYIINKDNVLDGLAKHLKDKEVSILKKRLNDFTLEEIGEDLGVTRERVRQIEAKAIKKLNSKGVTFKEDIYSGILKDYEISREDFLYAFSDVIAYNYIYLRYGKVLKKSKRKSIEDVLADNNIPKIFRNKLEKTIYKDYVFIGNEYIYCDRTTLADYIIRNFARERIEFKDFIDLYNILLEDIGESDNPKLIINDRTYENRLRKKKNILWGSGKKLRYYPIDNYDMDLLLEEIDLHQYKDIELSAKKIFDLHRNTMNDFDIQDEYELHNLLKSIYKEDDYPDLVISRNPTLKFGSVDRGSQVLELLINLAPVSNIDLANAYEEEYGVKHASVLANYFEDFSEYFHDGIYKIDFKEFSTEQKQRLSELLIEDFYFISQVKKIFKKEFNDSDIKAVNPRSIKSLGFEVYSNYIIKDKYTSSIEYIKSLFSSVEIINVDDFPKGLKQLLVYLSTLNKLKKSYDLVEFSYHKYIALSRLKIFGLEIEMIEDFVESVKEFVGESRCFTIHSINEDGFYHEIYDFGFDDYFYTSLLINNKEANSHINLRKNKIIRFGKNKISLDEFIMEILYSKPNLSMDIYEFIDYIKRYFDINIEKYKLISIVNASGMYYDKIYEKIYLDYDVYFELI